MNPPYLVAATDVVYTINWNDGTDPTTITADDLAAAGDQVTHVFPGMTSGNTVTISVDVNVGSISGSDTTYTTYTGVGGLSVTVDSTTATTTAVTLTNDAANLGDTAELQAAVTADVTELRHYDGRRRVLRASGHWRDSGFDRLGGRNLGVSRRFCAENPVVGKRKQQLHRRLQRRRLLPAQHVGRADGADRRRG